MGKCSNCGKKIQYNQFKKYRGKILCYACYNTRLERKRARQRKAEEKVLEDAAKLEAYNTKNEKTGDNMPVEEENDKDTNL